MAGPVAARMEKAMANIRELDIGTRVRSHYAAQWFGEIVAIGRYYTSTHLRGWVLVDRNGNQVDASDAVYVGFNKKGHNIGERHLVTGDQLFTLAHSGVCLVKVTHDRHGEPVRKPLLKTLDCSWLEVIKEKP